MKDLGGSTTSVVDAAPRVGSADSPWPIQFEYDLPTASARCPVFARQAAATTHPFAAQAALRILDQGGNAIDAALAAATTACVVEPTMNGLGGDLFAMVWDGATLHGLNASGRSPQAWSAERFRAHGAMPALGWDSVTVPGVVSGWVALWKRFGSVPFPKLFESAIGYATDGFAVMPHIAHRWREAERSLGEFSEFARVFLPAGRTPDAGSWFRLPDLARSLADVAHSLGESFYRGELADKIVRDAKRHGAAMTTQDLASHEASWVDPIAVEFNDFQVHELPPNGQGLATLIALGILRELPLPPTPSSALSVHLQLEAMKLALWDCSQHVGDPTFTDIPMGGLLAPERLRKLALSIGDQAAPPRPRPQEDHGTVYLTTADRDGRVVSLIQSNYLGFGSGVVVPDTGITLHNRGLGFSLDPARANYVRGGALPYHTIMPGFVTRAARPVLSFGVMGGHMQPQGHVQLALRCLLWGQNPQRACEAPRWYIHDDDRVALEAELRSAIGEELIRRGHQLMANPATELFGGAQAIACVPGGYCAATDPRKDGQAVGS